MRVLHKLFAFVAIAFYIIAPSAVVFAQTSSIQRVPTCQLYLKPATISIGGSVTLSWTSTNAASGAITNVGNVGPSGSKNLLPSSAAYTTYIGSFTGPGGTANCSATVTVSSGGGGGNNGNTGSQTTTQTSSGSGSSNTTGTQSATLGSGGGTQSSTLQNPSANGTQSTTLGSSNAGAAPSATGSASPTSNTSSNPLQLVPCGYGVFNSSDKSGTATDASSTGCQACSLAQLVQNLINFLIGLSIPIAAALFAWAGVLYFTSAGDTSKHSKAKGIFTNTFIGFVIVITAWLVINTFLNVIFGQGEFKAGNWFNIQCSVNRPITGTIGSVLNGVLGSTGINTLAPATSINISSLSAADQTTIQNALNQACTANGDMASCYAYGGPSSNGSPALTDAAKSILQSDCQSGSATAGTSCTALTDYANAPATVSSVSGAAGVAAGIQALNSNAYSTSQGICATNVRLALIAEDAASGDTYFVKNYPPVASQYNSYLTNDGFTAVTQNIQDGYTPQQGDVAVFQPVVGHDAGHIEMYNGSTWVSDFTQPGFYASTAYQTQNGSYTVYRK